MINIAEIMSTQLCTLTPDASLIIANQLMTEQHIRHIPILSEARLVGIVSHRDLLRALPVTSSEARDYAIKTVSDVMTRDFKKVSSNSNARTAAMMLERHKIGCLPVLDDEILVGIVTDSDFVAIAINLMEQVELNEEA